MLRSPLFSRLGRGAPLHLVENISFYTRWVGVAKLLLLFAALGLVLVTSAILIMNSRDGNTMRVVFSSIPSGLNERPIMQNPKYEGVDARNRPYTITARQAAQTRFQGEDFIQMQQVNGEMTMSNGLWLNVSADDGTLASARKLLQLKGNVALYTDSGYEMHTPTALVNFADSSTRGQQGIDGQGPAGTLRADQFIINTQAQTARFDGKVFVRLYMQ